MDPDEAHYAQLTREMLRAGNWMMPLLDGLPYIDKPVLFHWLQGLAIAVLGETETAMRLPSAFAALLLFWITRWMGRELFDERTGVRAWIMLATMPLTFVLGSIGLFDMVFTMFLFGAVAFALVAALRNKPRLQYISYIFLSVAVMTKGPVALVLAALFFGGGLLCGPAARSALLSLRWVTGGIIAVARSRVFADCRPQNPSIATPRSARCWGVMLSESGPRRCDCRKPLAPRSPVTLRICSAKTGVYSTQCPSPSMTGCVSPLRISSGVWWALIWLLRQEVNCDVG